MAHNLVGRGRGDGHGTTYELAGTLMLNNVLEIMDLTDCDLNGNEFGQAARACALAWTCVVAFSSRQELYACLGRRVRERRAGVR